VKCNVYCSNPSYFAAINAVYAEYFAAYKPARIFIGTAGWFGPFDMEIDCVAWQGRALLGTVLLTASAAAYSTAGFFTRLIHVDAWTLLFCGGLFGGSFLAAVVVFQERGRLWQSIRAMGWEGVVVAICSAVATVCFLNAMRLTAVADVMVIDAPFPSSPRRWPG